MGTEKLGIEELGIDKVKFVLRASIGLAEDIVEKSEGGFRYDEIIGIAINSIPDIITGIKNRKEFVAQVTNLSLEEKNELYAFAVVEFDIPDDKVERVVEAVLALILDALNLVDALSDLKEEEV